MSKAPSRIPSLARPSLPAPLALAPQPEAAAPSAAPHEPSEPQQSPPQAELSRDGSVRVAVRVRPLLPRELATSDRASVRHPTSVSIELPDAKRFTFDHVFPQATTQNEMYEQALEPWLDSFLQGFNVTVIAYGQTGSGKTYTMGNSMPSSSMVANHLLGRSMSAAATKSRAEAADSLQPDDGLIPRFLFQLFERLNKSSKDNHQVSVSFLEIYGEEIHDLLQRAKPNQDNGAMESLQLRETKAGVNVIGLTEVKVGSRVDAMEQMRIGSLRRITGRTEMNEHSSRSHAVYTIKVVHRVNSNDKRSPKSSPTAKGIVHGRQTASRRPSSDSGSESGSSSPRAPASSATVVSKLTFVDLAGSERLKKTLAEGNRMKEGIQINVGLLALGNVINALGDERRRGAAHLHVPYRSSKLTRLLQDALGGNSRTLFIACVSPSSSNSQETNNTLQYANRAKNIQNKAVKNIDSRSAELLNLKAFNQLLRRELIKARFIRPGATGSRAEAMVDAMLTDSTVLGYLKKLEQLAVSNLGAGSSSAGSSYITPEVQRALASLSTQFADVARIESSPETPDDPGDDTDLTSRESDFDYSNSGDDAIVEVFEEAVTESPVQMAPFSLYQLSRTLDIISLTLEANDIEANVASHHQQIGVKISDIDAKLHRKELVRQGLAAAREKMESTLSEIEAKDPASEKLKSCQRESKRCADKIKIVEQEIQEMKCQRELHTDKLEKHVVKCREGLRNKHDRLQKVRQRVEGPSGTTLACPLDILIRSSELKHRFNLCYLIEMADLLVGEEKDMASYLDQNEVEIAFMSSLFSKDEMKSSTSYTLFQDIMEQMRDSLDKEDLNASLSKEIRRRAMLLQNIIQGWIASQDKGITEQQFLASNEQQLRTCEENIADISAALRSRRESKQSISALVDSVPSLDIARSVIKRLIEEIYSQKRVYMAFFEGPESVDEVEPVYPGAVSADIVPASEVAQLDALTEKFERELLDTLDMVTSFNASASSNNELSQAQSDMVSKKYAAADAKIEALQQRELSLTAQLSEREEAEARLKQRVKELEDELKASEVKRESIRLMDRCQEIWTELGLNAEDQASKFNDINELLLKKCSEELEGLEAAREALQKRIEEAYTVVKLLETALDVESPIDLQMLHSVAGKTLLEQEKHLLHLRSRLTDELWLRIDARIAGLDRAEELLDDMKLRSIEELRHVPQDLLQGVDLRAVRRSMAQLGKWNELRGQAKADLAVLQSLVDGLVISMDKTISTKCLQQDEVLLSALLREKTKRVTEVEEVLSSIRSVSEELRLSPGNIASVLRTFFSGLPSADDFDLSSAADRIQLCTSMIVENGGGARDISTKGIETLISICDVFAKISEGRSNALAFLVETLQDADALMEEAKESVRFPLEEGEADGPETLAPALLDPPAHVTTEDFGCYYDALTRGKNRLEKLTQDMEAALCTMLSSINGEFDKYGIDSAAQRVTFFVGHEDRGEANATRSILEKYVFSSSESDTDDTITTSTSFSSSSECLDSLISKFDPDYDEFHTIYCPCYGARQLKQLRDSIKHVSVVREAVKSAEVRLRSLHTIMSLYDSINSIKKKIAEFEEKATDKSRFSGSSLRLLEEEKFRKAMSKKYPARLASLRAEVQKWMHNESGDYDLNILGHDMKNMIMDMMNTDTELMHLDLSVVDGGRNSARRGSKTQLVSSGSSSSLCSNTSNQSSTGTRTSRSRSQPAVASRDKKLA